MRTPRASPRWSASLLLVTLILAALGLVLVSPRTPLGTEPLEVGIEIDLATHGEPHGDEATLGVSGSVGGLYPGATVTLPLAFTNPNDFVIEVVALDTAVGDASPDCPAIKIDVGSLPNNLLVAAGSSETIGIPVHMLPTATDDCQGARFPLAFSATARDPFDASAPPTPGPQTTGPQSEILQQATTRPGGSTTLQGLLPVTGATIARYLAFAFLLVGFGATLVKIERCTRRRAGRLSD